jgi:hypothetical protein
MPVAFFSLAVALSPAHPSLHCSNFPPSTCRILGREIDTLPVCTLEQLKAFSPENDAESACGTSAAVKWCCEGETCGRSVVCEDGRAALLTDALRHAQAPIAARLATANTGYTAPAALATLLADLADWSGRQFESADAYMTGPASRCGTASIGFHCDDVDVLLIMLSGSKRFRVAGRGVGSPIVIDHVMEPGDAIYIPATFFHSGGDSSSDSSLATESSSTLLSVAMEPADALSAHETVTTWRRARESVRRRLPGPECNSWGWAGSAEGAKMVRQILGGHESTRRFCVG